MSNSRTTKTQLQTIVHMRETMADHFDAIRENTKARKLSGEPIDPEIVIVLLATIDGMMALSASLALELLVLA